ncbi:uncharacterized protein BDZ99DRAFT_523250 [Mytilinidion resinicola]|uniref:Uncharacterized protein n=1 Tax=Mytilinidion resinicola TaxID=574789 RepID=A0A6A6YDJ7_9PEZI|nr:uncharacterized protein BDZ99DRAFT_523250 [Mytilinidion resinicola]KAF2806669.1 hypothetical protein BDZ99DRAFT_523250 [Mytilinidion resinicola]
MSAGPILLFHAVNGAMVLHSWSEPVERRGGVAMVEWTSDAGDSPPVPDEGPLVDLIGQWSTDARCLPNETAKHLAGDQTLDQYDASNTAEEMAHAVAPSSSGPAVLSVPVPTEQCADAV